jgi:N-acetylglucosamine kinase-like BadF-type ATPase
LIQIIFSTDLLLKLNHSWYKLKKKGGAAMFDVSIFAANLRAARKGRGFSQKELAAKLYLSTQAVSKWERGEALPDLSHVCRIAEVLGFSTDKLLGVDAAAEAALIAVDGGGSKTEFVLITPQGQVLRRLVLPGSNPNACGIDGCCAILRQGIDSLLQEERAVKTLFIGGAGMASGGNGEAVQAALRKAYPQLNLRCRSDITNILALAADPDNALALICGTGCVVYAARDGQLRRFGGGGWRLETLGSGYDMGRQALLAALEHRDGTGAQTSLTHLVEQRLGDTVWNCVSKLSGESNGYIAAFAPLALEAWEQGDAVATAIVESNLERLSHLVTVAAGHTPQARQVILGGSLLTRSEALRTALQKLLPTHLDLTAPGLPPVWGACLQCARLAGLPMPDEQLFMNSYKEV